MEIIIYVNNAPIIWYSKPHDSVETSSFGSDFFALRVTTYIIEALRYKLRYFRVPLEVPKEVFFDNKQVIKNFSTPISVLNKIQNAIFYHKVREY